MNIDISIPSAPSPRTLTEQQLAVVRHKSNLVAIAVAGSGKTYTLMMKITSLVEEYRRLNIPPQKLIALLAFNNKMAKELKMKIALAGLDAWCECGTVHSFGNSILRRNVRTTRPNGLKLKQLSERLVRYYSLDWRVKDLLAKVVDLAKNSGIGITEPDNTAAWSRLISHHDVEVDDELISLAHFITHCQELLKRSNEAAVGQKPDIDYSDMIYLPLLYKWKPLHRYAHVFLDEAQDTNEMRMLLCDLVLDDDGIFTAVGDPAQAIYGFTGAHNEALAMLTDHFSCETKTLSYCFRCSRAVVNHARKIVTHIEPAPNAPEGSVTTIPDTEFAKLTPDPTSAILCRKNAPLISLAFTYIGRGIPCRIEGRDFGETLKKLSNRWKVETLVQLEHRLNEHYLKEIKKLTESGEEEKVERLHDERGCMTALITRCRTLNQHRITDLHALIDTMFADSEPGVASNQLTLSSVHKSKGLEWPTVYLLGRNLWMPSKFARLPWQKKQEDNLIYVAITRAQINLIEVTVTE